MTLTTGLLLVGLIVFITHALEAITGFGCTVLAFPFVIAILNDIEQAKILLSILAWLLALYFVLTKFKDINWKQFVIISLLAGVGMPIGMIIFKSMDSFWLKKILGIFIVMSAGIQLTRIFSPKSNFKTLPEYFNYNYLFLGGVIHGAFATGGPLIVLYSAKNIINKSQFRATMCLLWTTLNSILMVQYYFENKLTKKIGFDLLILLPFLIAGIIAGEIIHSRVSEILFKKIVFLSLLVVGCVMIIIN